MPSMISSHFSPSISLTPTPSLGASARPREKQAPRTGNTTGGSCSPKSQDSVGLIFYLACYAHSTTSMHCDFSLQSAMGSGWLRRRGAFLLPGGALNPSLPLLQFLPIFSPPRYFVYALPPSPHRHTMQINSLLLSCPISPPDYTVIGRSATNNSPPSLSDFLCILES